MIKFVIGFVLGFIVAQVGFGGLARMFDNGLDQARPVVQELSR